jgi:hypothetical protein
MSENIRNDGNYEQPVAETTVEFRYWNSDDEELNIVIDDLNNIKCLHTTKNPIDTT